MKLRRSDSADIATIQRLIRATIESSYAEVYPPRAVRHFKEFHSAERIRERQVAGAVLVAELDGQIVATGAIVGADISGVFVHPQLQGHGVGEGERLDYWTAEKWLGSGRS